MLIINNTFIMIIYSYLFNRLINIITEYTINYYMIILYYMLIY